MKVKHIAAATLAVMIAAGGAVAAVKGYIPIGGTEAPAVQQVPTEGAEVDTPATE